MLASDPGGQPSMGGGSAPASGGGTYYAPPSGAISGAENYTAAQNAYNNALIRYNQQRTGLLRQYGYAGSIDPTSGMVTGLHVDTSNPYGGLQQMLRGQAQEDTAAENALQDRGVIGGLANQAQSDLAYAHHAATGGLAGQLLGGLDSLNQQQLDSKTALDQALWQEQQAAAQQAISQGDFNPADLTGLDGTVGPDGQPDAHSSPMVPTGPGSRLNPRAYNPGHVGTIPARTATRLVQQAVAHGQPVSEHGLGQERVAPPRPAARPNAYTSGRKKRG